MKLLKRSAGQQAVQLALYATVQGAQRSHLLCSCCRHFCCISVLSQRQLAAPSGTQQRRYGALEHWLQSGCAAVRVSLTVAARPRRPRHCNDLARSGPQRRALPRLRLRRGVRAREARRQAAGQHADAPHARRPPRHTARRFAGGAPRLPLLPRAAQARRACAPAPVLLVS